MIGIIVDILSNSISVNDININPENNIRYLRLKLAGTINLPVKRAVLTI
jgi:hypothetical protein